MKSQSILTPPVAAAPLKLLKPSEVADMLGVKASTLEAWRCRGTGPSLPWVKVGAAVRYRPADVAKLIDAGTVSREAA